MSVLLLTLLIVAFIAAFCLSIFWACYYYDGRNGGPSLGSEDSFAAAFYRRGRAQYEYRLVIKAAKAGRKLRKG